MDFSHLTVFWDEEMQQLVFVGFGGEHPPQAKQAFSVSQRTDSPAGSSGPQATLDIKKIPSIPDDANTWSKCYGIVAALLCDGVWSVVVVSNRKEIGTLDGDKWYCVTSVHEFPLSPTSRSHQSVLDRTVSMFQSGAVYFSTGKERALVPRHLRDIDDCHNFFWNKGALKELISKELAGFSVVCIYGFARMISITAPEQSPAAPFASLSYDIWLIARRDSRRAGPRYMRRGCDPSGNTANSVYSEQIVIPMRSAHPRSSHFSLIRGSVPLVWSQPLNLAFTPKARVEDSAELQRNCFEASLKILAKSHENVAFLNLLKISPKSHEGLLTSAFEKYATLSADLKVIKDRDIESQVRHLSGTFQSSCVDYLSFDLNTEGKSGRSPYVEQALEALMKSVRPRVTEWGVGISNPDNAADIKRQAGVFRVNCLDSLDRTNLVQMHVARAGLDLQLQQLNLPTSSHVPTLQREHQLLWVDHGDDISKFYSGAIIFHFRQEYLRLPYLFAGTGALHSQVTRSGKKTLMGTLHDAKLSLFRLYLNYHDDPVKQDALYLLMNGRYPPPPQSPPTSSLSIQSTIAAVARAFR
jgi:hypothetical protein